MIYGNEILVYKTKKYGIPCERKFEINAKQQLLNFLQVDVFNKIKTIFELFIKYSLKSYNNLIILI